MHPLRPGSAAAIPPARGRWLIRSFLVVSLGLELLLAWGVNMRPLAAQDEDSESASRENRIKAAYLYQFGRYIEWPATAFPTPQAPFVIGVMDNDPILPDLEQIAQTKKIQDRPIRIQHFSTPSDITPCHILYLSGSIAPEIQAEIIRKTSQRGTLLVGDDSRALDWGCVVRFFVEDNKIRIVVARKAAKREGLLISAKLLQVAHIVD